MPVSLKPQRLLRLRQSVRARRRQVVFASIRRGGGKASSKANRSCVNYRLQRLSCKPLVLRRIPRWQETDLRPLVRLTPGHLGLSRRPYACRSSRYPRRGHLGSRLRLGKCSNSSWRILTTDSTLKTVPSRSPAGSSRRSRPPPRVPRPFGISSARCRSDTRFQV